MLLTSIIRIHHAFVKTFLENFINITGSVFIIHAMLAIRQNIKSFIVKLSEYMANLHNDLMQVVKEISRAVALYVVYIQK